MWWKIVKAFYWLAMKSRVYTVWSKIYEFIWDRNKSMPLKKFASIDELAAYVHALKWRPDTWRELGDAISSPENVQWLAENDPGKFVGDCDDFASFESAVVSEQGPFYVRGLLVKQARIFNVYWHEPNGDRTTGNHRGFGGHNMCLLDLEDGTFCYMDYGTPSQSYKTLDEMASTVPGRWADSATIVGHAVWQTRTFKLDLVSTNG